MSTYRVAPEAFGSWVRRLARVLIHVALFVTAMAAAFLVIGLGTWLYHWLFGSSPLTLAAEFKRIVHPVDDIHFVGFTAIVAFLFLRLFSSPHKFKVLVSNDFLVIEASWWWQRQHLWRNDVEYVKETPGGGLFMSPAGLTIGNKKDEIFIPAGAENYEQIRSELSHWALRAS